MQALGIFVALALLSFSLAVPVIDILKDEELRNDMLGENSALHVQKMTKECKVWVHRNLPDCTFGFSAIDGIFHTILKQNVFE